MSASADAAPDGAGFDSPDDLDALVGEWLSLAQVAELTGEPLPRVRQRIREGRLVAVHRGHSAAVQVPARFVSSGAFVKGLSGTLTLLRDAGYSAEEAVRWLFTPDDSLPGTPIGALAENRGREVKRRAQALAF